MSINKAILLGNLGNDPEFKSTNNGKEFASFRLATNKSIKSGEDWIDKTEWHSVVVWNENLVKKLRKWGKKGLPIYVEGELTTRTYEKDGTKRYATEVVIDRFNGTLDFPVRAGGSSDGTSDDRDSQTSKKSNRQNSNDFDGSWDFDDEIPF